MPERTLATQHHQTLLRYFSDRPILGHLAVFFGYLFCGGLLFYLWFLGKTLGLPWSEMTMIPQTLMDPDTYGSFLIRLIHFTMVISVGFFGGVWFLARRPQTLRLSGSDLVLDSGKRTRRIPLTSIMDCGISRGTLYVFNEERRFAFGGGLDIETLKLAKSQIEQAMGEKRSYTPSPLVRFLALSGYAGLLALFAGFSEVDRDILLLFALGSLGWFIYRPSFLHNGIQLTRGKSGTVACTSLMPAEPEDSRPVELGFEEPVNLEQLRTETYPADARIKAE